MTAGPLIDLNSAGQLLREAVPTWEDVLEELEAAGGRLKFRPELSSVLTNLKIDSYPLLGLDPIPRTGNGLILKPMITQVQGCPRRRSALATNRPTRWATRVVGRGFRDRRVSFQS
jgi:hypothetical protein